MKKDTTQILAEICVAAKMVKSAGVTPEQRHRFERLVKDETRAREEARSALQEAGRISDVSSVTVPSAAYNIAAGIAPPLPKDIGSLARLGAGAGVGGLAEAMRGRLIPKPFSSRVLEEAIRTPEGQKILSSVFGGGGFTLKDPKLLAANISRHPALLEMMQGTIAEQHARRAAIPAGGRILDRIAKRIADFHQHGKGRLADYYRGLTGFLSTKPHGEAEALSSLQSFLGGPEVFAPAKTLAQVQSEALREATPRIQKTYQYHYKEGLKGLAREGSKKGLTGEQLRQYIGKNIKRVDSVAKAKMNALKDWVLRKANLSWDKQRMLAETGLKSLAPAAGKIKGLGEQLRGIASLQVPKTMGGRLKDILRTRKLGVGLALATIAALGIPRAVSNLAQAGRGGRAVLRQREIARKEKAKAEAAAAARTNLLEQWGVR